MQTTAPTAFDDHSHQHRTKEKMQEHKTCIKNDISSRPLRTNATTAHADITVPFSVVQSLSFVRGGGRAKFNSVCTLHLHAPNMLSVKKNQSIFHAVTDKRHATPSRLRCVLCLRHGENAGYRFQRCCLLIGFSLFFIECVKSDYLPAAPHSHTHKRYRHNSYVPHFYSPRFN